MGATYGTGLLGFLRALDHDQQIETMTRFAPLSMTYTFREVIGDKVAQWSRDDDSGDYALSWLEPRDAEAVLAVHHRAGGSAPYSMFQYLDGWQVMVPGWDIPGETWALELPDGSRQDLCIRSIEDCVDALDRINAKPVPDEFVEFHAELKTQLEAANEHKLVYCFGW